MIRIVAGEGFAVTALLETAALNAKYVRVPLISNMPNLLESIGNHAVHSPTPMPFSYKIDKERKLVMSTGYGVFTLADALAHQEKLRKDPDFDPSFCQLTDLTHVTKLDLRAEDVRRLAQASIFAHDSRRAILVTNDTAFGLARMFEILRSTFGEKGIQAFRNLDDALDWVLAKDTAP
jgi:hypothetical protein